MAQTQPKKTTGSIPDPALVLGGATLKAGEGLGLSRTQISQVLGTSEATLSRVSRRQRGLDPDSKEGELALLLVRLYRSLDALVGGSDKARREWMRAENNHLGEVPAQYIAKVPGLVNAVEYLDALRG